MQCNECHIIIECNSEHYILNGHELCSKCYNKYCSPQNIKEDIHSKELHWEYKCQTCLNVFSIKVPHGPKEEKAVRCSTCGSSDIQRINKCNLSNTAAGG